MQNCSQTDWNVQGRMLLGRRSIENDHKSVEVLLKKKSCEILEQNETISKPESLQDIFLVVDTLCTQTYHSQTTKRKIVSNAMHTRTHKKSSNFFYADL